MDCKYKIALLDGNGVLSTQAFWKEYFSTIGVDFQDPVEDLDLLSRESVKYFPNSVCINSKYR